MTEGRVNHGVAIDEGIVVTNIRNMQWPERDNLQKQIYDSWPRVAITRGFVPGAWYTHYIAPLGFLVARHFT